MRAAARSGSISPSRSTPGILAAGAGLYPELLAATAEANAAYRADRRERGLPD